MAPLPGIRDEEGGTGADADADVNVEHDSASDARTTPDSGSDVRVPDPAWASWRVPPAVEPKYDLVAGIARDKVSGLEWQRVSGAPANWETGRQYCENLELGGFTDWRLPTRIEATSLVDFRTPRPYFHPYAPQFLDPEANCMWTISTEFAEASHWIIALSDGRAVVSPSDDQECAARCVRGTPYDFRKNAPPDYVIENGTVRDPSTRLEWQAHEPARAGKFVGIDTAEQYCSGLRLLGRSDWRLPTVKELATLIDERRAHPAFDPRVAGESHFYWSSTVYETEADGGRVGWRVSFVDGIMEPSNEPELFDVGIALVRCVRDY